MGVPPALTEALPAGVPPGPLKAFAVCLGWTTRGVEDEGPLGPASRDDLAVPGRRSVGKDSEEPAQPASIG